MQAYTEPLSLWRLVEQHVEVGEQDVIKNLLCASLVDQSLELHNEIEMLVDIWREMRDEKSDQPTPIAALPEPPNQRDRLVQEICFLVENVKEKAKRKGIDPQHILKKHNPNIIDYANEVSRPGSAVSRTSRLSDGRETPMMPLSPERMNLAYEVTDEVEAVNCQLNYLDFDEVCVSLRSALEKEIDQLMEDIQFLQGCLDSEADVRDCVTPCLSSREPTLTELREERSMLEKDLLASDNMTATPVVTRPMFTGTNQVLPRTPPGHSGTSSKLSTPTPIKATHTTASPVKAKHDVVTVFDDKTQEKGARGSPSPMSKDKPTASDILNETIASCSSPSHSKYTIPGSTPTSILPNPPTASHSESVMGQSSAIRRVPHSPVSRRAVERRMLTTSASSTTGATREGIIITTGARRRTVSPGRVRVVDVTNIVDTHTGKGDSTIEGLPQFSTSSSSSASTVTFSPSPPSSSSERDSSLRPRSAHADRFRKMVMGCRDGE